MYRAESTLNALADVNVMHLRPGYFFHNFLGNVDMVKHMNIIGSNFGGEDFKLVLADPNDIAAAAASALLKLDFTGHTIRYIVSDERSTADIAAVLGKAVNKPELHWVLFTDEQALAGLQQAGLPEEVAKNYTEMGQVYEPVLCLKTIGKTVLLVLEKPNWKISLKPSQLFIIKVNTCKQLSQ